MASDPDNLRVQTSRWDAVDPSVHHRRELPSLQRLPKIDLLSEPAPSQTTKNGNEEKESSSVDPLGLNTQSGLLHDQSGLPHGTSHSLAVPFAGNRIRRKSAPSMLEPIQEGLLGAANRRNSGSGMAQITLDRKDKLHHMLNIHETPFVPKHSQLAQRRRSDPIGLLHSDDKLRMFSVETRYPAPKRNSLVSATLDELTSQFELLDRRKRVVEETELPESEAPSLPPILITDS